LVFDFIHIAVFMIARCRLSYDKPSTRCLHNLHRRGSM